jgi:glutaredoxin 2
MSEQYTLYQYDSCPFCALVRRYIAEAGLDIPMKDTLRDAEARRELIAGGGDPMVPCLRIEQDGKVRWMYESRDIIAYLRAHAVPASA